MRPKFLILVDVVLIAAATVLALVLRSNFDVSAEQVGAFLPYLTVTTLTSAVVIYCSGMDRQIWRFTMLPDYLRLANLCIAIVVCTLVAVFAYNRMDGVARALPIIQIILMSVALISARVLYRVHRARRTGRNRVDAVAPVSGESCVLIVGLNPVTELFVNCARLYASKRIAICGIVSERPSATAGRAAFGLPVLGEIAKLSEVLSTLEVHGTNVLRLVVTADLDLLSPSQRLCITALERRGDIAVEYFAEQLDFVERRRPTDTALIVPFKLADTASFDAASLDGVTAASRRLFWPMKRGFDAAVAALILTLLAAPLLIVGLLALVAIGAPVLFWQYRPGLYGLRFKVYKFRTMLGAHDKAGVRIPDGERRSGLGSIMRVIRVDELP